MKLLLHQYAAYNLWANKKIIESIRSLDAMQHHKEIINSFDTLYKTVFHIWGAENLWLQRIRNEQNNGFPKDDFGGRMELMTDAWQALDGQWLHLVDETDETFLEQSISYTNLKGDTFSQPVYQLAFQVFNHNTYHRGQLVTVLRQLGLDTIPNTDFITWSRMLK